MLLCDIGNSFAHLFDGKKMWREEIDIFLEKYSKEKLYYINVNEKIKKILKSYKKWIDLEKYVSFDTKYIGMGIDRQIVCIAIEDGVVVDAGSAITVDIMDKKTHKGGFIIPGFKQIQNSYKTISPKLDFEIDFEIDLEKLPMNTKSAISYGAIKPIVLAIKDVSKNKSIFFTGGDGKKLQKYFPNSIYDNKLIFKGMIKVIKESL